MAGMNIQQIWTSLKANWETTAVGIGLVVLVCLVEGLAAAGWMRAETADSLTTWILVILTGGGFVAARTAWKSSQDSGVRKDPDG